MQEESESRQQLNIAMFCIVETDRETTTGKSWNDLFPHPGLHVIETLSLLEAGKDVCAILTSVSVRVRLIAEEQLATGIL